MFKWNTTEDPNYLTLGCNVCSVSHVVMDYGKDGWKVFFWFNHQPATGTIAMDLYDGWFTSEEKPDLDELKAVMEEACVG